MTSLKMPKLPRAKLPTLEQTEKFVAYWVNKYENLSPENKERLKDLFQKAIDIIRKKDGD
jgi:hypothetical protein